MILKGTLTAGLLSLALAGCGPSGGALADTASGAAMGRAEAVAVTVHRSESCGCCRSWIAHLKHNGFQVSEEVTNNLAPIKERVGIPVGKGSCHTAQVAGYFVEGHVPASDIRRLLAEYPAAKGLTVPGMPVGSPGMETSTGTVQPYDVLLVARDGSTSVFAHHSD